jgi:PAS domain S-box-containing protein
MRINWKKLKPIISSAGCQGNQYLTVVDEEGHLLMANARMQKEFKLKNPKQIKSSFFDLLHPLHIEHFRDAFRNSTESKSPYAMELHLKNGVYHSMKWQVTYLSGNDDELKSYLCLGTFNDTILPRENKVFPDADIMENIVNAFVEKSPNLSWVVDEGTNLVYANKAFFQYFKLDENALNKKIAELLPLAVADALYENHRKVLRTGLPLSTIEKGKTANDKLIVFRVTLFPLDAAGGKKMIGGIASNQSDKYMAEQNLEIANERIRNLNKVTSDAIWEWDMKTGEIFRNEKLIELTGFLPEDDRGLTWWLSRVHIDDRDKLNETLKEVTDKNLQSWKSEYRFLCADGEYKNILDHGFLVCENGMPVKMIGSLNDITGEKLMENLLVEEKLRQFKNISEAVIRSQEQEHTRLGREMHDNVNQILSTIKLFASMLTASNKKEKDIKQKTIEYTMLAIEEIRKLSKEMVAPQLDGGTLAEHIQKIIDDIELSTKLKIKFTYDTENELLSPGKKLALFRIVQEQIKNILKYSKADHVEILLQGKREDVQLIILDNGIGFDVRKSNNGVGLASIKDRVKFYNGLVEIKSSPGEGCLLNITMPLHG